MKKCLICKKKRLSKKLLGKFSLAMCWNCWDYHYRRIYLLSRRWKGIFDPEISQIGKGYKPRISVNMRKYIPIGFFPWMKYKYQGIMDSQL